MVQEMHFINIFIDMPMTTVPRFVIKFNLNCVKPVFNTVVNRTLINSRQKTFCWSVLIWTSMRKYNVDIIVTYLILYTSFYFI